MQYRSSLPTPGSPRKAQDLKYLHSPFTETEESQLAARNSYSLSLSHSLTLSFNINLFNIREGFKNISSVT